MTNEDIQQKIDQIIKDIDLLKSSRVLSQDIGRKVVKNRHIDGFIVHFGDVADRPDGTTGVKVYFAEDESKLYIYNDTNEAWEGATFS